jgi:uncharacterized protein YqeY
MYKQVEEDLRAALKAGRSEEVGVLRLLKSALDNARIDKGEELDEADCLKTLEKEAKQRRESIESYQQAGRTEKAEAEQAELGIIERYLPEAITGAEIDELITDAVAETGATHPGEMSRVMRVLQPRIAGRAKGSQVAERVRQHLS